MFTSTFIFEAKPYDDDFHRLNSEIAERARAIRDFSARRHGPMKRPVSTPRSTTGKAAKPSTS